MVIEEEQKVHDEEEEEDLAGADCLNQDIATDEQPEEPELTISEHRKEFIYETFEARPRHSPVREQFFPKVTQHKAPLPLLTFNRPRHLVAN